MAIGKNGSKSFLTQQYDKLLLLAVGIGLLVSLCYLAHIVAADGGTRSRYKTSIQTMPSTAVIAPQALDDLEKGRAILERPPRFTIPKLGEVGIFVAEKRMACAYCRKPIPYGADSCLVCGKEQPKPAAADPNRSTVGDGIPDAWKRQYQLDVTDKELANKDVDEDGFTVREEYEGQTNPTDKSSHPDVVVRMRVKSFKGRELPFEFRSYSTLPNKAKSIAIHVAGDQRMYYVREGGTIAKTGFKVKKFHEKFAKVKDAKLGGLERKVDISEIEVVRERDGKVARLAVGKPSGVIDQEAVLVLEMDQFEQTVETGSEFTLRGKKYTVEKVDEVKKVVLIKEHGGKDYTISM